MQNKKVLIIGNYTKVKYHSLRDIEQELCSILENKFAITCSEDYGIFCYEHLKEFDSCICYIDNWDGVITQKQVAGLLSFVACGGGLLVIHNGISLQNNYELAQLMGAKFTGHPPYSNLKFSITSPEHTIMQGICSFEMEDEPYQFDFDKFSDRTVLLEYVYNNTTYPAAWAQTYGIGRVAYLMPGHSVSSFMDQTYRQVVLKSAEWTSKLI